ncbi:MAG: chorismate-binding protein [Flammeovirgaceae bacterium]|jgi:anthranilate synthase component 1|nr:chorismate-binding protein [Flammeovirgaceae bacterium]
MEKRKLYVASRQILADTLTPVNLYLKLRDVFAGSILLESSDYHGQENSMSLVCCKPFASFKVSQHQIEVKQSQSKTFKVEKLSKQFDEFLHTYQLDESVKNKEKIPAGVFGYTAYNVVKYLEKVPVESRTEEIPDMVYQFFHYVLTFDHFYNIITLYYFTPNEKENVEEKLDEIQSIISFTNLPAYQFQTRDEEKQNVSDATFLERVEQGKKHCFRGDVFQIVLSRKFSQSFTGDEFNVYRALRSVNPSPYLFYFDFGSFKLFGSSPEAQIQIKNQVASIYPIAGTFKRTGNDKEDLAAAERLAADEKETAEHIMLVDLARNDLSRHADNVQVQVFKEVQFYSHVIHLVSKVSGKIDDKQSATEIAFDTFPAGTLSGAPKHKAMHLINQIENEPRGFYGGAIGFMGLDNSVNQAIMIRTFLSKQNTLHYQAGAGVVAKSDAASELQEVNNKLGALRKALHLAKHINGNKNENIGF